MAEMDLKLRIIPDIALLKKSIGDLTKDATGGVGGKAEDKRSKDSKKLLDSIKGLTKIVGIVAIGALIIRELLRVFEPVIKLLGVILSLLLLPLVPLLKPILLILADMAKNIASSAGAFLAGDISLGEFIAQAGAELITGLADIIPVVLDIFVQIFDAFLEALPTLIPILGEALVKVIDAMSIIIPQIIEAFVELVKSADFEKIIKAISDMIIALIPLIGTLVEAFVDVIVAVLDALVRLAPDIIPDLIDSFVKIIEALLPLIPLIMDSLIIVMDALVRAMFAAIGNILKGFFFGRGGGKVTDVTDAIIKPGGQIIRTDPRDTLIATQNPEELGGGSTGFIFSPTINLNGPIASELDVRRIAEQIAQIGADALSRKTGSLRF